MIGDDETEDRELNYVLMIVAELDYAIDCWVRRKIMVGMIGSI